MFVLELLGTLSLRGDARPVPLPAKQKRPLGLLAVLALGGRNGVARDRIEAYLWPESGGAAARHSLDQTVYASRHALGSDVILSTGRELRLNPDLVRVDVWEFEEAIRNRQWTAAVERYAGALLDGVHLADSRELESWVDAERTRLLAEYQGALEYLVAIAEEAGDHAQRVTWCRRLANADPLSAPATKQLMLALVAAGDRAGAVRHARVHQQLVRQQLEMEPDAEIAELAASVSRPAVAASSTGSGTPMPAPDDGTRADATLRHATPRAGASVRRSRLMSVAFAAGLAALLIAAATVGTRQVRGRGASPSDRSAPNAARSPIPAARDAYLHAAEAWSDGSRSGLDTAVAYFGRAIELDSGYAAAYAGLADAYVMLGYFGYRTPDAMFPRARDAALHSLRLDSTLAAPHPALAYALTWERDFVRAESEFRTALALEPPRTSVRLTAADPGHQWYPILLMLLAQKPEVAGTVPRAATTNAYSLNVPVITLTFTKWVDEYPAMTGFTSDGPGTLTGAILSRIDDGKVTHLVARYELASPGGAHSLKTVVQGTADNAGGQYHLNGVVAWGWMTGARVQAIFQRYTPCDLGTLNVCFRGTIQLRPQ